MVTLLSYFVTTKWCKIADRNQNLADLPTESVAGAVTPPHPAVGTGLKLGTTHHLCLMLEQKRNKLLR